MSDEALKKGMAVRREVLGDDHVDRATAAATPFTKDFQEFLTAYAWGEVWTRPGLDLRTRSCITVAMLVALNRPEELVLHLRGALNNGVTQDELKEVLLQAAVYCGVPAANAAFKVASELLDS
jgi:3-oxoadipate enol-lactonase / 4-carboxymuconolactone decarboxylase